MIDLFPNSCSFVSFEFFPFYVNIQAPLYYLLLLLLSSIVSMLIFLCQF